MALVSMEVGARRFEKRFSSSLKSSGTRFVETHHGGNGFQDFSRSLRKTLFVRRDSLGGNNDAVAVDDDVVVEGLVVEVVVVVGEMDMFFVFNGRYTHTR